MIENNKNFIDRFIVKLKDTIINKFVETLFTTNTIIVVSRYVFDWNLSNKILHGAFALFCYFTLFLGVILLFNLWKYYSEQQAILKEYIALKDNSNWEIMFDEKLVLEELIERRGLKTFEASIIDLNLISEYCMEVEATTHPYNPEIEYLQRLCTKLENGNYNLIIINNLLNHRFIEPLPNRDHIYIINNTIWKYAQKENNSKILPYILQQIFSVKNSYRKGKKHKVITILGIKIKFKKGERK